jgi:hypothetical protein
MPGKGSSMLGKRAGAAPGAESPVDETALSGAADGTFRPHDPGAFRTHCTILFPAYLYKFMSIFGAKSADTPGTLYFSDDGLVYVARSGNVLAYGTFACEVHGPQCAVRCSLRGVLQNMPRTGHVVVLGASRDSDALVMESYASDSREHTSIRMLAQVTDESMPVLAAQTIRWDLQYSTTLFNSFLTRAKTNGATMWTIDVRTIRAAPDLVVGRIRLGYTGSEISESKDHVIAMRRLGGGGFEALADADYCIPAELRRALEASADTAAAAGAVDGFDLVLPVSDLYSVVSHMPVRASALSFKYSRGIPLLVDYTLSDVGSVRVFVSPVEE